MSSQGDKKEMAWYGTHGETLQCHIDKKGLRNLRHVLRTGTCKRPIRASVVAKVAVLILEGGACSFHTATGGSDLSMLHSGIKSTCNLQ